VCISLNVVYKAYIEKRDQPKAKIPSQGQGAAIENQRSSGLLTGHGVVAPEEHESKGTREALMK